MKMDFVRLFSLIFVKIVMNVQAQVTFVPDPEETVPLDIIPLPTVEVITVKQYNTAPMINVQYVTIDGSEAVYDVYNREGIPLNFSGTRPIQFRVSLDRLRFIAEPALVGGTFRLRATLDNNTANSTLSNRRYTFPAPFNLTGSSMSAVLYSSFSWTCHTTPDNPGIDWLQDGRPIAQMSVHDNGSCTIFNRDESYPYIYTCRKLPLTYTLTIPGSSLTQDLQNSTWRCKYPGSEVLGSKIVTLNIIVPVTNVSISPGSGSTLDVDDGQIVTFTCTTNNANPAPTILWYIGSSDVTSQAGSDRTTLTLNVTRVEHQMSVWCVAWNSGNQANLSDSTTFNVKFPPADNEELQITGYTSGQVLFENSLPMISINCIQPGGNPVANMTFSCGSQQGINGDTATEAIRRFDLANNRTLNGQICNCASTHINGFTQSKSVSVVVYYPPSVPTISASSPFPWKSEGTYNLTCNTTLGNPAATSYIWKEGGSVLPITSQTYEFKPLNSTDNGRQLSCQVNNNFTLHQNVDLTSSVTTLQVEFQPATNETLKIVGYNSGQVLYENNSTIIDISCIQPGGNPVANMSFTCGSETGQGTNENTDTEAIRRLSLTKNRILNGLKCECVSTHINGYARNKSVTFTVYYDPDVTLDQSSVEVIEGHTAVLRCSATGNPMPTVTWYRDSIPVTGSTISSSTYNVTNASRTLTGYYTCKATSSSAGSNILQPDEMNAHLRVFYPPAVQIYLQNTTENTRNHTLRCSAAGDPNNATIVAIQQRIGSTFIRNITSFTELSPGNMTWNIPSVSYQDMGTYTCLASNGIPDRSNQKIQSDTAYLNVITSAKFEMLEYIVRSDIGTSATISIPFYINPPADAGDMVWINNSGISNDTLESSSNVSLSLSDADVNRTFNGVDVTLHGQSADMDIPTFQDFYEGNYTLKIRSSQTYSVEVRIALIRSGPPDTPSSFQLLTKKVTSVVLMWNKGSDGGHPQTFVILYKEKTSDIYKREELVDTSTNRNITYEIKSLKPHTNYEFFLYSFNEKGNSTGYKTLDGKTLKEKTADVYTKEELDDRTTNRNITYEIKSLKPGTNYEFLLYSLNKKGNSTGFKIIEERTLKAPVTSIPDSLNSGIVGGAVGGGAAVLVVVIVIIVIMRRRLERDKETHIYQDRSFYTDLQFDRPTHDEEERAAYTMLQFGQQHTYSNIDNVHGAEGAQ